MVRVGKAEGVNSISESCGMRGTRDTHTRMRPTLLRRRTRMSSTPSCAPKRQRPHFQSRMKQKGFTSSCQFQAVCTASDSQLRPSQKPKKTKRTLRRPRPPSSSSQPTHPPATGPASTRSPEPPSPARPTSDRPYRAPGSRPPRLRREGSEGRT